MKRSNVQSTTKKLPSSSQDIPKRKHIIKRKGKLKKFLTKTVAPKSSRLIRCTSNCIIDFFLPLLNPQNIFKRRRKSTLKS